jgi:hypothetical protein
MGTINGFPVIAMWETRQRGADDAGRYVVVDRGPQYEERYVSAWQSHRHDAWSSAWSQSVYCATLAVAREIFVARVQKEVL